MSFDKPGGDGSGKCGIEVVDTDEYVLGVLYQMHPSERPVLDKIEGLGYGYVNKEIVVIAASGSVSCFTYYPTRLDDPSPPYDWYKAFVLEGAKENHFPRDYLNRIESTMSKPDQDKARVSNKQADFAARPLKYPW